MSSSVHHLLRIIDQWTGPISLGIVTSDMESLSSAMTFIHLMRQCPHLVRAALQLHIVLPFHIKANFTANDMNATIPCNQLGALHTLINGRIKNRQRNRQRLPQNIPGNLAIAGCQKFGVTHFLAIDIDLRPSPQLHVRLERFLVIQFFCARCLYVLPAFEAPEAMHVSSNKAEVVQLMANRTIDAYHRIAYNLNQRATQTGRWLKLPPVTDNLFKIAYEIDYEFAYEGFYVAPFSVPRYVEMFIGDGTSSKCIPHSKGNSLK